MIIIIFQDTLHLFFTLHVFDKVRIISRPIHRPHLWKVDDLDGTKDQCVPNVSYPFGRWKPLQWKRISNEAHKLSTAEIGSEVLVLFGIELKMIEKLYPVF